MAGKLIALEGIDGSGTTTQAGLMNAALAARGYPVHLTQEPSNGPIGSLVKQVLRGRMVSLGRTGPRAPGWAVMGLMFAADRLDHVENEIAPNLGDGINVVCDRYLHSSIVYQSVTSSEADAREWLTEINRFAVLPDLVLYLDVDPAVAQRRRIDRKEMEELYDDGELQARLAAGYRKLFAAGNDVRVITLDGSLPQAEVHARCMAGLAEIGIT